MDLKLKQIKAKLGLDENETAITADVLAEMVPIEGNLEQKIGKLHEKVGAGGSTRPLNAAGA